MPNPSGALLRISVFISLLHRQLNLMRVLINTIVSEITKDVIWTDSDPGMVTVNNLKPHELCLYLLKVSLLHTIP